MRGSQIIKGARATDGSEVKENDGERNERYRCSERQVVCNTDVGVDKRSQHLGCPTDNFDGDVVAECQ